jgi:hypothetical protein
VTFGSYDAKAHVSIFAAFRICGDVSLNHFSICSWEWTRYTRTDPAQLIRIAQDDCLTTKVLTSSGRQLLGPQFLKDYDHFKSLRTVSQVTNQEALTAAVDLINSAEQMAKLTSEPPCTYIGGPIRAVLLDESHSAPFKLQ